MLAVIIINFFQSKQIIYPNLYPIICKIDKKLLSKRKFFDSRKLINDRIIFYLHLLYNSLLADE